MGLTGQTHSKYDVTSVAISPDGQYILSGSDDGTVGLWDFQGNPIVVVIGKPGCKWSVIASATIPSSKILNPR